MKVLLMKLITILSIVMAVFFRITQPVSNLLKRLLYLSKAQSKVTFSIPVSSQFDGELTIIGTGNITWGEHCRFGKGVVLETQGDGVIEIGDNVRINQGSVLVSHDHIIIGNDCLMGEYCSIRDANHKIKADEIIRIQEHDHAPINIENDCWIGRGAVVLKGVNLGVGCVVGASSLVMNSFSKNTVAVGVPAKGVKKRER